MMGQVLLAELKITCSAEQKAALIARQIPHDQLVARLNQVCQDATSREIARLTTQGPESNQGWQQRCNACRQARAEECALCSSITGRDDGGVTAGDVASSDTRR